ncbi:hypothetical protein QLX08_011498 [Tetragonisca angustula]|uniref:Uncharacterized protein n=1 Tax=Tetragonisca angustula TaxID=166442 RepID=A0AAW0Z7R8_9HYME
MIVSRNFPPNGSREFLARKHLASEVSPVSQLRVLARLQGIAGPREVTSAARGFLREALFAGVENEAETEWLTCRDHDGRQTLPSF